MRVFLLIVLIFGLTANVGCDMMTKADGSDKAVSSDKVLSAKVVSKKTVSKDTEERLIAFFKAKYATRLPVDTEIKLGDFQQSGAKGLSRGEFILSVAGEGNLPVPFLTDKDRRYLILGIADVVDLSKLGKSEIAGFKKGEINLPGRPLPILISNDGNQLVVGDIFDSTVDPLQEILSKIELENVPLKGSKGAKVTVVEYSDFQCPYCKRASDMLPDLTKKYKGKIKVVFKQFPLPNHNWAKAASIASLCAYEQGNDKFWQVHDLIFANQAEITLENSDKKFKEFAKQSKLNRKKFNKCLGSDAIARRVDKELEEGRQIGVNSTPTFIVDGIIVPGASMSAIENAIDSRL